ncbi:MAG: hypothetical protein JNM29_14625 [Candidatus Odyssella sp.]|nr:hypothetical protein [Candidatus Odyssella sp.]
MKRYALLLLLPAFGVAACQSDPPPPPPQTTEVIGVVQDVSGACHVIVAESGASFAVRPGVLPPNALPGARVRVVGVIDPAQSCPGRTLLRADGGVTVIAEAGPPPRRMVRRDMGVPK